MRELRTPEILRFTYDSNCQSVATYGIILWGQSPGLQKILITQKAAVRAICGAPKRTNWRILFRLEGNTYCCGCVYTRSH
ncbi:hypothetical protein WA026_013193 [Henosepilachna vigintioctopunctata]|uniref:Uncharacterized protein n=1 Tax=Henosepilachna vigintioctopunctata TaxID=420089 RepID=A0AAW1UJ66_9CUCU